MVQYSYSASTGDEGQKAYIRYEITETETTWSVTYSVGVNAHTKNINYENSWFSWGGHLNEDRADGTTWEKDYSADAMKVSKGDNKRLLGEYTRSAKKTSDGTRMFEVSWSTGVLFDMPVAYLSLTIPALKHYTVAYNANGGSGAPNSNTKWYGQTLTLRAGIPTRTGYKFKGWATSPTGAVKYQPLGKYTANASATLYAVWEYIATDPTITNLIALRNKLEGEAYVDDDEGTVARVRFNWTKGILGGQVVEPTSITVGIKGPSDTEPTTTVLSNITANTIDAIITNPAISTGSVYEVTVTISTANLNTVTATTYISESYFVLDFNTDGTAIGVGKAVEDTDKGIFIDIPVAWKRETLYQNSEGWAPSTSSGTTVDGAIANYSQVEVYLSDGSHGICGVTWENGEGSLMGMLSYPYNEYIYVNAINFGLTADGNGGYTLKVPMTAQMPANYRIGTSVIKVSTARKLMKIVGLVSTYE